MKRHRRLFIMFAAMLVGVLPLSAAVQLDVSANRDSIYLGESIMLTVKVSGDAPAPTPDLSAIRNASVELLGSQNQNYSSTSWVNGKRTHHAFRGTIFTYRITPQRTGTLRLGPISAGSGRNIASLNGPSLKVTGIEEQDDVIVRVDASRDTVLVDENFEITLHIYIKCLDGEQAGKPSILADNPPHLSIPYLAGTNIEGLEHTDTRTILQGMINSRQNVPAFTINNYTIRNDPFDFESMFNFNEAGRETPARFTMPAARILMNGKSFWHYELKTQYIAREERTHTFGPVIFKGHIIDNISTAGAIDSHNVFTVGASQTVRVVPPPEEGRPGSFIGAIGTNMLAEASLDTQNCRVGDPLTLTLTVSGSVNLKNIYPPDLSAQPALLKQFRVYEDTLSVKRDTDSISFVYTIRPTVAGTLELPPIDISYFDSASRTYRTVRTSRIPITATDVGGIDTDMILGGSTNATDTASRAGASIRYIAPFVTDAAASKNRDLGLGLAHVIALVGAPMLFLLSLAFQPIVRLKKGLGRQAKKRSQYNRAISRLRKAAALPAAEAAPEIAEAMRLYFGARFSVKAEALTPPDLKKLALNSGLTKQSITDLTNISERIFNASFTSPEKSGATLVQDAKRVTEIIDELEALSSRAGSSSLPMLLIIAVAAFALTASAIASDSESDFLWQKAWSRTLSANSEDGFLAAAKDYSELIGSGVRNEYVFYNMGTALLMAGDRDNAVLALERAERYGGMNARLLQNIQIASAAKDELQTTTSWLRTVFFWHYILPMLWRTNIAIAVWTWLFILLAIGRLAGRRTPRTVLIVTLLLLAAFGSSALTSLLQENQARVRDSYISQPLQPQRGAQ